MFLYGFKQAKKHLSGINCKQRIVEFLDCHQEVTTVSTMPPLHQPSVFFIMIIIIINELFKSSSITLVDTSSLNFLNAGIKAKHKPPSLFFIFFFFFFFSFFFTKMFVF